MADHSFTLPADPGTQHLNTHAVPTKNNSNTMGTTLTASRSLSRELLITHVAAYRLPEEPAQTKDNTG
jgi:hypothetical protein